MKRGLKESIFVKKEKGCLQQPKFYTVYRDFDNISNEMQNAPILISIKKVPANLLETPIQQLPATVLKQTSICFIGNYKNTSKLTLYLWNLKYA